MKNVIIDTGPIVALFDKDDNYHSNALNFFQNFRDRLITTWPVITEVSYMLSFNLEVQRTFFEWIQLHAISIHELRETHIPDILGLLTKYSNVPMDLADASILLLANQKEVYDIITFDSDYYIYQLDKKKSFKNLLQGYY